MGCCEASPWPPLSVGQLAAKWPWLEVDLLFPGGHPLFARQPTRYTLVACLNLSAGISRTGGGVELPGRPAARALGHALEACCFHTVNNTTIDA